MERLKFLCLVLLSSSVMSSQLVFAADCPQLNRNLKNKLLVNSNYEFAFLDTFSQVIQKNILGKNNDHCPDLIQLDQSIEAFGVLLREKSSNRYHVLHAVKCDCKGGPGWRIAKIAEFSDDIPIIKPVTQDTYFDSQTHEKIEIESRWKTISVELLHSGDKYLFKRQKNKSIKHKINNGVTKAFNIAKGPGL